MRRQAPRTSKRGRTPPQARRTVAIEIGPVGSMANRMAMTQASMGASIVGKELTLVGNETADLVEQEPGLARLLWGAGQLRDLGTIRLGESIFSCIA